MKNKFISLAFSVPHHLGPIRLIPCSCLHMLCARSTGQVLSELWDRGCPWSSRSFQVERNLWSLCSIQFRHSGFPRCSHITVWSYIQFVRMHPVWCFLREALIWLDCHHPRWKAPIGWFSYRVHQRHAGLGHRHAFPCSRCLWSEGHLTTHAMGFSSPCTVPYFMWVHPP